MQSDDMMTASFDINAVWFHYFSITHLVDIETSAFTLFTALLCFSLRCAGGVDDVFNV